MILGSLPIGSAPIGSGDPVGPGVTILILSALLAGLWTLVPDLSVSCLSPTANPTVTRRMRTAVLNQSGFTVFFNTSFARNWQGGMTFVKPSGAIFRVSKFELLYGVDRIAGAISPTGEFVAYQFGDMELNEVGEWTMYLTSARETLGTGQGTLDAGSGPGTFLVLGRQFLPM